MNLNIISELLSYLEKREAKLLSWGFYDIWSSADEIEEFIKSDCKQEIIDEWEKNKEDCGSLNNLLANLASQGLLYANPYSTDLYRTRFAESIRLTARLKQMFRAKDWLNGPNLVSDIKIHLAHRQYPKRNISPETCWGGIEGLCLKKDLQKEIFNALAMQKEGHGLSFSDFQLRGFKQVLAHYREDKFSGTVICAGTSSGKTKAFYVPAYLGIVSDLANNQEFYTKVIAIYPRNVLLADQLREAIAESQKIAPVLKKHGLRQIRFGALLGSAPRYDWFQNIKQQESKIEERGWKRVEGGYVIPYLNSPSDPKKNLVWRDKDRKDKKNSLFILGTESNIPDIADDTLVITREDLEQSPPDVLFLSAEMLNRELGNSKWGDAFGVGKYPNSPRLLLLDEAHSYDDIGGAQISWLLRRWQYFAKLRGLHVVGLSATLDEASKHLSGLANIPQKSIETIMPTENEMEAQSMEYNLAIKGDPVSGASLLATTIQCGMLLRRLLTPSALSSQSRPSEVFYGKKVFGFSDNLDSVNRWYSDMLDAENNHLARLRQSPQNQLPPPNPPPARTELKNRFSFGQIWDFPEKIGHSLNQSLNVTRCSSQDPGTSSSSDLIIATSALEVGFDDPEVGGMLHHMRPRRMSSFIQRKGRAGRTSYMRPWTIVVLSDYGGDRLAFENAERLFIPRIDRINLPINNPYVLKIQIAYFFIEWLGREVRFGSPFNYLSSWQNKNYDEPRRRAVEILDDFIMLGPCWERFKKDAADVFVRRKFGAPEALSAEYLDALLWEYPRPFIRQAIPALRRKLISNWQLADPQKKDKQEDENIGTPLPGVIPRTTFFGLNLAEVIISFDTPKGKEKESEVMDASKALFETCPGRVSKRFCVKQDELKAGYWHNFSEALIGGDVVESVHVLFPNTQLIGAYNGYDIYQPRAVTLKQRPKEIKDSSYASWVWNSIFLSRGAKDEGIPIFKGKRWCGIVTSSQVFLHRNNAHIEVLRFANSCDYSIRRSRIEEDVKGALVLANSSESDKKAKQAIGFQQDLDGFVIKLDTAHLEKIPDINEQMLMSLKTDYYLEKLNASPALKIAHNKFVIQWIWQISLAMLTETAVKNSCTLAEAQNFLEGHRGDAAKIVIEHIFNVPNTVLGEDDEEGRLKRRLLDVWNKDELVQDIVKAECCLWECSGGDWETWIKKRYVTTFAQAFRYAVVSAVEGLAEDDFILDIQIDPNNNAAIYMTELESGGLGQAELVLKGLRKNPELFERGFLYALTSCQRSDINNNLLSIVQKAILNKEISDAFELVRGALTFKQIEDGRNRLVHALRDGGFLPTRSIMIALLCKVLKPGSVKDADRLICSLNAQWSAYENTLGISIDSRVFAYLCMTDIKIVGDLTSLFKKIYPREIPGQAQLYQTMQQMLFSDCKDSCEGCLDRKSFFGTLGRPSRQLAIKWLNYHIEPVNYEDGPGTWLQDVIQKLKQNSRACLRLSYSSLSIASEVLFRVLQEEIDVNYLLAPVSVSSIKQQGDSWYIELLLKGHEYE